MNDREEKGREIAKTSRITEHVNGWVVPSQSGHGNYSVIHHGDGVTCNCPDFELSGGKCKHIWAVEYLLKREADGDRRTVTKTVKVTYSQDWASYDKAQTNEQDYFMKLLADLCGNVRQPAYEFGRPSVPLADMAFVSALKVYSTFSLRRFASLMRTASEREYIERSVHYSTVARYMEKEDLTPVLAELIRRSSIPLASVERDFAVDSSGFSTCKFDRWFNFKYGKAVNSRKWVKAHITCGVKTNIITAVRLTESRGADSPQFRDMVEETARNFRVREVSADAAYLSRGNLEAVENVGGTAFIPFKKGSTGKPRGSPLWAKMYHYFMFNREEFLEHYHKRSNAESVFHMIKAKFGDHVRSKTKTAQINEVLLKILCHNICVLIQETFELGIDGVEKVPCGVAKVGGD